MKGGGRPRHLDHVVPYASPFRAPVVMPVVRGDGWGRWRKCPTCHAVTGEACRTISGGPGGAGDVVRDRPHSGRQRRKGAAS